MQHQSVFTISRFLKLSIVNSLPLAAVQVNTAMRGRTITHHIAFQGNLLSPPSLKVL